MPQLGCHECLPKLTSQLPGHNTENGSSNLCSQYLRIQVIFNFGHTLLTWLLVQFSYFKTFETEPYEGYLSSEHNRMECFSKRIYIPILDRDLYGFHGAFQKPWITELGWKTGRGSDNPTKAYLGWSKPISSWTTLMWIMPEIMPKSTFLSMTGVCVTPKNYIINTLLFVPFP